MTSLANLTGILGFAATVALLGMTLAYVSRARVYRPEEM